ncbi:MAG: aminopeptidase P family protein [Nitrososphaerota archaeon]|nr:aminopeptidase P family protein [Nitrososphaerota archaeon]
MPTAKNSPTERCDALFKLLDLKGKSNVQTAIISDPKHVFYFTGFFTWRPRFSSFLLLRREKEPVLLVGSTRAELAEKSFRGRVVDYNDYDVSERMVSYADYVSREFVKFLNNEKVANEGSAIGIESWNLANEYANALTQSRSLDISKVILEMRKTKGTDELEYERKASKRLAVAYKTIKDHALAGETELGLFAHANLAVFKNFDPLEYFEVSNVFGDFASGKRTFEGSGGPTRKKLVKGDLLILDLQASCNHYWVDTCRTYIVGKKPTPEQERAFRVILKAKKNAEEILRPGTRASEVYKVASNTITEAGYKPLHHHAGHGLGLDDQESPFFLPNSEEIIEEGDVCAVEPGVYDKSFGGMRVEDNYIITKDGFEKISKFPLGFP